MAKPSLFEHPKFKRLCRRLAIPRPYVVGHLELLWHVAHTIGNPTIGDEMDVEIAADWKGEPGELAVALEAERFLDRDDDHRLVIHNYRKHAPKYAVARADDAERANEDRACEQCGAIFRSSKGHARFCSNACRQAAHRQQTVTDETEVTEDVTDETRGRNGSNVTQRNYQTDPYRPVPTRTVTPDSPEPNAPQPPAPAAEPRRRRDERSEVTGALMVFPTVGKGPTTWALTEAQREEWQECYPGVDVLVEAREALAWIKANPGRRKTAAGMPRFFVNWLSRTQNRRGGRGMTTPATARGRGPDMQATLAWKDECARLHGGRCSNAMFHAAVMAEERAS